MSNVFDLDALAPRSVTIKYGDELIEVPPPKTKDVLKLAFLGQKLQSADELSDDELEKVIADITERIYLCVPALAGKSLNMAQMTAITDLINQMSMPQEIKGDENKKVTVNSDPKDQ